MSESECVLPLEVEQSPRNARGRFEGSQQLLSQLHCLSTINLGKDKDGVSLKDIFQINEEIVQAETSTNAHQLKPSLKIQKYAEHLSFAGSKEL